MTRHLHLNALLKPAGQHLGGWRHPATPPDAGVNIGFVVDIVRRLEAAKFDAVFIADLVGLPTTAPGVLPHVSVVNDSFEPLTLLAALSTATTDIGLLATVSTSFNEPYTVARTIASIDHLSRGRAGWNVVTSLNDREAQNFGLTEHLDHDVRYRRAAEFVDVVTGLWDSFDDDAFVRDTATGVYFEPDRLHFLDHRGEFFRVAGPLNIPRPPQGHPVIVQAGTSEPGRELGARIADVVFGPGGDLASAREYYVDIKRRAADNGRDPERVLVLPAFSAIVAPTLAEAEDKASQLADLIHPRVALADVEYALGFDLAGADLDGPLPALPPHSNRSATRQAAVYEQAKREDLTIRQLAARVAESSSGLVGTPTDVADHLEEWFTGGAADGFTVSFAAPPTSVVDFTELVVPELQRRGLFRTEYESTTLRGNLGLGRPASRFADTGAAHV